VEASTGAWQEHGDCATPESGLAGRFPPWEWQSLWVGLRKREQLRGLRERIAVCRDLMTSAPDLAVWRSRHRNQKACGGNNGRTRCGERPEQTSSISGGRQMMSRYRGRTICTLHGLLRRETTIALQPCRDRGPQPDDDGTWRSVSRADSSRCGGGR